MVVLYLFLILFHIFVFSLCYRAVNWLLPAEPQGPTRSLRQAPHRLHFAPVHHPTTPESHLIAALHRAQRRVATAAGAAGGAGISAQAATPFVAFHHAHVAAAIATGGGACSIEPTGNHKYPHYHP